MANTTPFGLRPGVLVMIYFGVLCFTGQIIGQPDPLQQMMLRNGAFAHLDPAEALGAVQQVIGNGLAAVGVAGVFIGKYLDMMGPKVTAVTAYVLQVIGLFLLYFTDVPLLYNIGAILMGVSFQSLVNSHISVSAFFPANTALVLAILGAAPDLALFVPTALDMLALQVGDVRTVIVGYIVIAALCCVVSGATVPWTAFGTGEEGGEGEETLATVEMGVKDKKSANVTIDKDDSPAAWKLPFNQQFFSFSYLSFVTFFTFCFYRKLFISQGVRQMFFELEGFDEDSGNFWTGCFNALCSFGFIPSIAWGALVDGVGFFNTYLIHHCFAIGYMACTQVSGTLSYVTFLALYISNSSYMFGSLLSFVTNVFGFRHLPMLQGIAATGAGLSAMVIGNFKSQVMTNVFDNSVKAANSWLFTLTIVFTILPIAYILISAQAAKMRQQKPEKIAEARGALVYTVPIGVNMMMLDESVAKNFEENTITQMVAKQPLWVAVE